jgi:hypothetical protein
MLIVFKDSFGESHVERVFRTSKDGEDLSGLLKQLIAATANDSSELKDWYDALVNEDEKVEALLVGRNCVIETEYRGDYVNIKTIRSGNDRDNGGGFFQSVEADTPRKTGTPDTGQPKRYLAISEEAASFF